MSETGLDVRVFTGMLPHDEVTSCIHPSHLWVTRVDLGERLAFRSMGEYNEAQADWRRQAHEVKMVAIHELSETLPGYIEFYTDKRGREEFRLTSEGRRYALQFVKNPEATRDTLIRILLNKKGLRPTYPPHIRDGRRNLRIDRRNAPWHPPRQPSS